MRDLICIGDQEETKEASRKGEPLEASSDELMIIDKPMDGGDGDGDDLKIVEPERNGGKSKLKGKKRSNRGKGQSKKSTKKSESSEWNEEKKISEHIVSSGKSEIPPADPDPDISVSSVISGAFLLLNFS